jgi:hypothetical protein|tara:strand:+ start:376 stop:741 length:366 start_codon:yes stop_codon:yes gene_type:complete
MKLTEIYGLIEYADKNGFFDLVEDEMWENSKTVDEIALAFLTELRKRRVIRNRRVKLKAFCPPRMKYSPSKKACVMVSTGERVRKKRGQRRAAIKRKAKGKRILRKRMKSLRLRKSLGLRR